MKNLRCVGMVMLSLLTLHARGQQGWNIQSSNTNAFLQEVWAIDTSVCVAVGGNGTILRTTDGGTTWNQPSSGTTAFLNSVFFIDPANGTVVGDSGILLRTTDAGQHWERLQTGTTNMLMSVAFSHSTVGFAVGERGTILRSTDGGGHWVMQQPDSSYFLYSVAVLGTDSAVIVGTPFAAGPQLILRTSNGGATWETPSSGNTQPLNCVSFTDAATGTAVGNRGTILRTTDAGVSWSTQTSNTTQPLYGIWFADSSHGTAVGGDGVIVHTTNGGASWTVQWSGSVPQLQGVSFADVNVGYAVGYWGTIVRTTTGGIVAVEEPAPAPRPRSFRLQQNFPNPFNPATRIQYDLPRAAHVRLTVIDVAGRERQRLVDEVQQPGVWSVEFNATSLPSGVYFYRLQAGTLAETKKLLLLR